MTPTAAPPRYRIVLVLRNGRRKPMKAVHSNFYRAADLCKYYEWRGQRQGRPVVAQIETVGAVTP